MLVEELKALPAPKLEAAAALMQRLKHDSGGVRGATLRRSAAHLSEADVEELARIIADNFEPVHSHDS